MSGEINQTFDRIGALLEFPCDFPIKVIGHPHPAFESTIAQLVNDHVPQFEPAQITTNQSKTGRYISLTVDVRVDSREQLQALYMALANHETVRMII